ncbi:hypothetical protein N7467_002925 [Penicillium canescens]|nr:hypothetical protein N7467_002925 [Penicillium canescens]
MARTAQSAWREDESPEWHQRQYLDHEGNTVILGKLSKVREFNEPEGNYQYSLLVYTKAPIQAENYDTLFAYLFGITDPGPFLEIYTTTQPSAFACVEHQRREIVHRKRLHVLKPSGSYIFLTSDSYLAIRYQEKGNQLRTTPLAINFSQRSPTEVREVELEYRVPNIYRDVADFVKFGNEVVSEAIKMMAKALDN